MICINGAWRRKVPQKPIKIKQFYKWASPRPLFGHFLSFQQQFYRKIVSFNVIQTQIVRVEGEHADHLTTATAQSSFIVYIALIPDVQKIVAVIMRS